MRHRRVDVLVLVLERAVDFELRGDGGLGRIAVARVLEPARDGDEDLVRRRWVAEAAQRLDLGLEDVAGLHATRACAEIELPLERHVEDFLDGRADGADDVHQRVALAGRERSDERLALLRRPALVDEELEPAVALVHPTRPPDDTRPAQPGEVDAVDVPFRDAHRDDAFAVRVRRRLVEVARAAGVAVAVLEPFAFEEPVHRALLLATSWFA